MEKIFSVNDVGKIGQPYAKESAGLLSHFIYKNQLKMDYNLNIRNEPIKLL